MYPFQASFLLIRSRFSMMEVNPHITLSFLSDFPSSIFIKVFCKHDLKISFHKLMAVVILVISFDYCNASKTA